MKCFANRITTSLLNIPSTAQVAVTTNGTAYRILPEGQDRLMDDTQDYRFVTNMDFAGGASSPTAQLFIQGSVDGATWIDLANGVSRTAPGNYREIIDAASVPLLPWIRARVVLGGGTAPNVNATVDIVSTGPFQLSTT
jgi:hypothetical protein